MHGCEAAIRKKRVGTLSRSHKYQARYMQLWIGICCKQCTDNMFSVDNIRLHFEHATVASPTFPCAVR